MTQDTPSIAAIVGGLSEAQKRAILAAQDVGPFFVVDVVAPWPEGLCQFLTLKTDRLTELGQRVRTALQEQSK